MKKILILCLSAALFFGCSDDKEEPGNVENQQISLSTEAIALDKNGNVVGSSNAITVTSTADWTLAGDVSWCTPSASQGANGATVTLTAATNDTGENREVCLYFICGNAAKKLTVSQFPEEVVELKDAKDTYEVPATGGLITVRVSTNQDVSDCEILADWFTLHRLGYPSANEQWIQFAVENNNTFYDRSGDITLFKGTSFEKTIHVNQSKLVGLYLETADTFEFGVGGGKAIVKATGNVDFRATISGASAGWLTAVETSSTGTEILTKTYEITCAAGNWTRTGVVTLSPASGSSIAINISQTDPNPPLFDVADEIFAKRLVDLGYLGTKDDKYYQTYTGYLATSFSISNSAYLTLKSIEGIERFPNITSFSLYYTNTRKVDLRQNTKLTNVSVSYNPIEELLLGDLNITTVSMSNALYNYYDIENRAQSFTASSSKLKTLSINHTDRNTVANDEVQWVDITGCPALTTLNCNRYSGKLKHIYVTQAQMDAYVAGTLKINTNAAFDKSTGIVVR